MKEIMDIGECMKKHMRKVEPDPERIRSIIKVADARLKSIRQIKKDDETTSIIVEGYYEIIKELLTALLLRDGFRSDNHECLISFFKQAHPQYEYESLTIHELKNIRNRINYDGIFVEPGYLSFNELEFRHIIGLLKGLVGW